MALKIKTLVILFLFSFHGESTFSKNEPLDIINKNYIYLDTIPSEYHSNRIIPRLSVEKGKSNFNCHTQGIGWCDLNKMLVVTCQGEMNANLLLYSDTQNLKTPISMIPVFSDKNYTHPSSIQITNTLFPIAISEGKNAFSYINFYQINKTEIKLLKLNSIVYPRHIGAVAYNSFDNHSYVIGVGWDARELVIWSSPKNDAIDGYEIIIDCLFSEIIADGDKIRKYNSLWVGKESDTGDIFLLASSGSFYQKNNNYIDFWRITGIKEQIPIKFEKMGGIKVKGVTKGTFRSLFFEGFTIKGGYKRDSLKILAAPHDYNKGVMKFIYEGYLINPKLN